MGTPLLYGSLSEVYSERSGVMNTAIEGIFLMGAWAGFVGSYLTGGNLLIGLLAAILAGILTAALYGWITIYLKQHQIVTGTAINILALGICAFFQRVIFGVPVTPLIVKPFPQIAIPLLSKIPVIGPILFNQNILTYILYILVPIAAFVLYKTSLGLSIRSIGENPEAGDVAGLKVERTRFLTILFAGIMCGIGGSFYSIGYLGMFTTTIIGGRGWIAVALVIFAHWNPWRAALGGYLFGILRRFTLDLQGPRILFGVANPFFFNTNLVFFLQMTPYILTIILTISRRSFNVPAKLGIPYRKEG
jgi:simple sugar transport system permease protein